MNSLMEWDTEWDTQNIQPSKVGRGSSSDFSLVEAGLGEAGGPFSQVFSVRLVWCSDEIHVMYRYIDSCFGLVRVKHGEVMY